MRVEVALFAHLTPYLPPVPEGGGVGTRRSREMDLPDGTAVGQVIALLGLPDEPRIVFVNGRHADDDRALAEGDRLAVFPPIAGG
jgi:sulfur carrier protein ThiS